MIAALAGFGILASVPANASSGERARVEDHFTREDIARANRYRGPRYAYAFGSMGVSLLALGLLALGPVGRRIGEWSARATEGRWVLASLLMAFVITIVPTILTLGFDVARWRQDRTFGLATNTIGQHLSDLAKANGFSFVIAAIAMLVFVTLARKLPHGWPLAVAAAGAALTVLLVYLLPVVYEPVFNRFEPVEAAVRARVLAIAQRAGVPVRDVLVADASKRTTKQNAYVSGLASTRRVVLYDTLLQKSSEREVDLVVAHELAHVKHNDVLKGTVLGIVGVIAGVFALWVLLGRAGVLRMIGASGPADPRALPFIAFFLAAASIVTLPAANAFSRRIEAAADRTALAVTGDWQEGVQLEVDLARDNIADLTPNGFIRWMFFTHPSTMERIQIALDYGARAR